MPHSGGGAIDIKVLILDPTGHVHRMLCDALRLHGFDVIGTTASEEEALLVASGWSPDVLVIDHQPPSTDGIAAAARLLRFLPRLPMILYPPFQDQDTETRARAAGAAACVGRTEGIESLEREIEALCLGRIA